MSVFMFREQEFSYSESKRMPGGCPWLCIFTRSKTQRILRVVGRAGVVPQVPGPKVQP